MANNHKSEYRAFPARLTAAVGHHGSRVTIATHMTQAMSP